MWKIVYLVFLPALGFLEFIFFAEEVDELTVKLVVFLSQALYRYQTTIRI